jgi:TRAP-type C4-dicarboxylate transport system permease small subunit
VNNHIFKTFGVPTWSFLIGFLFVIMSGFGGRIASSLSRQGSEEVWMISDELTRAWTYIPLIVGIAFLTLAVSTFSITYYFWQKRRGEMDAGLS